MRENIITLFLILILAFTGFSIYYYYKNTSFASINSVGMQFSNSVSSTGFQILGSQDGVTYMGAQIGGIYKVINITIYIKLEGYEGPEPFRVKPAGPGKAVYAYTSDYKYNYTVSFPNWIYQSKFIDNVYKSTKIELINGTKLSIWASSWLLNTPNNSILYFTVEILKPPRIKIYTSDAAGYEVVLENINSSCDLPKITLTLQWFYNSSYERFFKLLGVSTQGTGWCYAN